MSLPYIQLTQEEAKFGKMNTLSIQINILNLVKRLSSYKKLRKQEIAKKVSLKHSLKRNIANINKLVRELPSIEGDTRNKEKLEKTEVIKETSIESELKDIQEKLDRLQR